MIYWLRWLQAVCWAAMHDPDFPYRALIRVLCPIEWNMHRSQGYWLGSEHSWMIEGYLILSRPILWMRPLTDLPSSPQGYCPDSAHDEIPF